MKKIDRRFLFKFEFIANAGAGVDQEGYREGLIGFTGKICNCLFFVVLVNPEILFVEVGYQLAFFNPGILPASANSRSMIRETLNFRRLPRLRPGGSPVRSEDSGFSPGWGRRHRGSGFREHVLVAAHAPTVPLALTGAYWTSLRSLV